MADMARVALVCEGDASRSETAFSGTAKRMFQALQQQGHHVLPIDASLDGATRVGVALTGLARSRQRWRSKFRYGVREGRFRTAAAGRSLGNQPVDLLLQVGATYDPPRATSIPYAIFADWNLALNIAEARDTSRNGTGLSMPEMEAIDRHHARRYREAAVVFTISERLRQSFLDLYGLPPERVRTTYAGPNFDTALIDAELKRPKRSTAPTILFIAKEFHRKGGDLVAAAFAQVRRSLPDARLVSAGSAAMPTEFRQLGNVDHLGLLDKSEPKQLQKLLEAYRDADVLVLPSRQDPFPTVIREAMFFGLPVVASDIWAMPEMVEDGRNGFLIPCGDATALAEKLTLLLTDAPLRQAQGAAARARAEAMFTWPSVGKVLSDGLQQAYLLSREEA